MNEDRLIQEIQDIEDTGRTLEPTQVVSSAKRRRAWRVAVTGIASLAVAGVAVAGFTALGGGEPSPGDAPVAGPPVALGNGPGPTTPGTVAETGRSGAETAGATKLPKPTDRWTPGGPVGAKPIGTIPKSGAVEIAPRYRFETLGTKWCISEWEPATKEYFEPFGCRGTVGNSNLGDGRSPGMQSSFDTAGNKVVTSVFRGTPSRVIYTDGAKYYEAKVYRLAGVPGWSMSVVSYKPAKAEQPGSPDHDRAVFAYGADDKLLVQFPHSGQGGPKNDPLHQR
jgi:hypothetical protein